MKDAPVEDESENKRIVLSVCVVHFQIDSKVTEYSEPIAAQSFCSFEINYQILTEVSNALPIRKSSSCRTSTASLMLESGSASISQALRIVLGVISENFARKTCKLGFTNNHTQIKCVYHNTDNSAN